MVDGVKKERVRLLGCSTVGVVHETFLGGIRIGVSSDLDTSCSYLRSAEIPTAATVAAPCFIRLHLSSCECSFS